MMKLIRILVAVQCCLCFAPSLRGDEGAVSWARWIHGLWHNRDSMLPTDDGGIIMGRGSWLMRVDADGAVVWDKAYTGLASSYQAEVYTGSLGKTSDDGALAAGSVKDPGKTGRFDAWLRKFDSNGNIEWTRLVGSEFDEYAWDAVQTTNGGYVIAGQTKSSDGEDATVVKLSASLEIEWQRAYGTGGYESAASIIQTADGGFVMPILFIPSQPGSYSALLMKLDSGGGIRWQTSLRSEGEHAILHHVVQMGDGGYVAGGEIGELGGGSGRLDPWVVRLDAEGRLLWQKAFGGPGHDLLEGIIPLSNGQVLLVGNHNPIPDSIAFRPWIAALDPSKRTLAYQRSFTGSKPTTGVSAAVEASDGGLFVLTNSCCGNSLIRLAPGPRLEEPCAPLMLKAAAKPLRTKAKVVKPNLVARDLDLSIKTLTGGVKSASTSFTDFCRFPDIVGSWQRFTRSDNTVTASLVCENVGTRSTTDGNDSGFIVQVYLSKDAVLDAADSHLKELWVNTLRVGESSPPVDLVYKSTSPIAGQYLIAALDKSSPTDGSAVFESDETNNLVVGLIP